MVRITHDIRTRVAVRKGSSGFGSLDFEFRHNDEYSNVLGEAVSHVSSDTDRRLRRFGLSRERRSSVDGVRGENLCEGDRRRRQFGRVESAQERSGESSNEGCSDVVRVSLDHESVVLDALLGQLEVSEGRREQYSSDDCRRGRTETATKRYLVRDVDLDDGLGEREVVREEDVEGDSSDQILVRIQRCFSCSFADVAEKHLGVARRREGHAEGEVQGERET